jgi:rubrerythrin
VFALQGERWTYSRLSALLPAEALTVANLICPICGKLFYGIDGSQPCPHVKEKPDGTYEFVGNSQSEGGSNGG